MMAANEEIYNRFIEKYPVAELHRQEYLEEAIREFLLTRYKIRIARARYEGRLFPELLIVETTCNIFGYLYVQHHSDNEFSLVQKTEFDRIARERIKVCYAELGRPVFFLHLFSGNDRPGIYFMTSEQIQDILLRKLEVGDTTPFYPEKGMMGEFDEFIRIVKGRN
ncbi:MAG: hypothetical protein NT040_18295 [Bacteroidetes bacterium]|nr:hypothetical protein [Bacteroidota bacterium]